MVEAVITQLAGNLSLSEKEISLVSDAEVEFGDACLGVAMPEVMCAQVITPGRIIVLEAKGIQYEYHTSGDGGRIQPATFAFTWRREGGIAGFCDSMTVFLSGEVYDSFCISGDSTMGRLADLVSAGEIAQLNEWLLNYGQVDIDASDPEGVADRMVVTLTLMGTGNQQTISSLDRQELLEFAQSLHRQLSK